MNKGALICLGLVLLTTVLFALNLAVGSIRIPISSVWAVLMNEEGQKESWRFIILDLYLKSSLTALALGIGSSSCMVI